MKTVKPAWHLPESALRPVRPHKTQRGPDHGILTRRRTRMILQAGIVIGIGVMAIGLALIFIGVQL